MKTEKRYTPDFSQVNLPVLLNSVTLLIPTDVTVFGNLMTCPSL